LKTGMTVFYHFVGCSSESRDTEKMYRRLVKYLTGQSLGNARKIIAWI